VQQSILKQYPSKPMRVYVVWQPAYGRDTLAAAKQSAYDLFDDPRVRHIWDGENALAKWYTQQGPLESTAIFIWDAYYLYASKAQWGDEPSHLVDSGHPVLSGMDQLVSILTSLSADR
jgi:hypothetical protein